MAPAFSALTLFDVVLCVLIIGVALCSSSVRDLFAATVLLIIYGVFVAIAWVRLGAVDVALAEAAIGAGLTGVLLIGAVARLKITESPAAAVSRWQFAAKVIPASLGLLIASGLAYLVLTVEWRETLQAPVLANLPDTGVLNPVTAVLLNYRAYDTLLETSVLFAALIASWCTTHDDLWGERAGLRQHTRRAGILATFGRFLPPIGLIVGIHIFWAGADKWGGAFQAGTIFAAVWILAIMAGVIDAPNATGRSIRSFAVAGPMFFTFVALTGVLAQSFLIIPVMVAKPLTLAIEACLTLSIAATLMLLVLGAPRRSA
ncbi:MAG: DUF4040 domain-containing protein [Beijerinckiaceae bacterium]|nr:DUF4040 domain-containing protein [Beijerinckiaceae bacterium]